jgi:hypothetical protein
MSCLLVTRPSNDMEEMVTTCAAAVIENSLDVV